MYKDLVSERSVHEIGIYLVFDHLSKNIKFMLTVKAFYSILVLLSVVSQCYANPISLSGLFGSGAPKNASTTTAGADPSPTSQNVTLSPKVTNITSDSPSNATSVPTTDQPTFAPDPTIASVIILSSMIVAVIIAMFCMYSVYNPGRMGKGLRRSILHDKGKDEKAKETWWSRFATTDNSSTNSFIEARLAQEVSHGRHSVKVQPVARDLRRETVRPMVLSSPIDSSSAHRLALVQLPALAKQNEGKSHASNARKFSEKHKLTGLMVDTSVKPQSRRFQLGRNVRAAEILQTVNRHF